GDWSSDVCSSDLGRTWPSARRSPEHRAPPPQLLLRFGSHARARGAARDGVGGDRGGRVLAHLGSPGGVVVWTAPSPGPLGAWSARRFLARPRGTERGSGKSGVPNSVAHSAVALRREPEVPDSSLLLPWLAGEGDASPSCPC